MTLTEKYIETSQLSAAVQLLGIDYIEMYVGNVRQAVHYFSTAYGFTPIAYAGLETGQRDCVSFVLKQEQSMLILTGPLGPEGPIAEYVAKHGDAVRDVAFRVDDVAETFARVVQCGARPLMEPTILEDEHGRVIKATVATFGDTVHSFIQRDNFQSPAFLPKYQPVQQSLAIPRTGLVEIDHFAVSLPPGELDSWVNFYTEVLGFRLIFQDSIRTEFSAMNSKVVQDSTDRIKFVLIEPLPGRRRSQIEEFLKYNQGPGIQHVALLTRNIVGTVRALQANGVNFVAAPASYYEMLPERIGDISESTEDLRSVNVLVDRDEWGYLLQIFALPIQSRPTLFFEIIERKDARTFGNGNIQALFRALEREQAKRGNL